VNLVHAYDTPRLHVDRFGNLIPTRRSRFVRA
jgi:hypothetical protein